MKSLREFLRSVRARLLGRESGDVDRIEQEANATVKTKAPTSQLNTTSTAGPTVRESSQLETKRQPAIRVKRSRIDVWVGLDFGTSCTKVAYRCLDDRNIVEPIDFGHSLAAYPSYCIPSLISVDRNGQILTGIAAAKKLKGAAWNAGVRRIKILIAAQVSEEFSDPEAMKNAEAEIEQLNRQTGEKWDLDCLAVLIIADAMTETVDRLHHSLSDRSMDIRFNVCAPIEYVENNEVLSRYRRIVEVAHSFLVDRVKNDKAKLQPVAIHERLGSWRENVDMASKRVFLIPESVAEIASYLTSLERKPGLHALIDFGAGTTDICIFNLIKGCQEEIETFWYSGRILPRGASRIEDQIAHYLVNNGHNGSVCTEDAVSEQMQSIHLAPNDLQHQIHAEVQHLWEQSRTAWGQAYGHLSRESEWIGDKVQVIVSGGGSKVPCIPAIFRESWMPQWGPYPVSTLPPPDDYLDKHDSAPFDRMSVAYGLTFPEPELGKFKLPSKSPDHTPPRLPVRIGRHNTGWANY